MLQGPDRALVEGLQNSSGIQRASGQDSELRHGQQRTLGVGVADHQGRKLSDRNGSTSRKSWSGRRGEVETLLPAKV